MRLFYSINPILISSFPASEQRPVDQESSNQDLAAAATYQHHILHEVLAAAAPLR
jgi:hypothetical protein